MHFELDESEMAGAKPVKPTYTLYWSPESASLAPLALLEEVGAPYALVKVDIAAGEHLGSDYRAVHP